MPLSPEEQERQRVARLRQQQVSARDPGPSKIRGYDWGKHAAKGKQIKKTRKPFLVDMIDILPGRWKGLLIGLLLAILPAFAIAAITPPELDGLAALPLLIFAVGGYVLGTITQDRTPY